MTLPKFGRLVTSLAAGFVLLAAATPFATAQELRIASNTFATLDPLARNPISSDYNLHAALYSTLTSVAPDGEVVAGIATSWETPSALEWVFHLRDDVKFADGQPLDASVVAANILARIDPQKGNLISTLGKIVADVTAPDPLTLRVALKNPSVEFPRLVTGLYLTAPDHLDGSAPAGTVNPSGPYKLVSFDPDGETVLEYNPAHYGPKPDFEKVRFIVLPQVTTIIAGLLADELDFAEKLSRQDSGQLRRDETLTVGALSSYRTLFYRINPNVEPLGDQRVRQALNHAIDKQAIIDNFVDGGVVPVGQVLNPSFAGHNPDVPAYGYDPEKARALLAEAGQAGGFDLELEFAQGQNQAGDLIAQVLAQQLGEVGIRVSLTPEPFQVWSERTADPAKAAGLSENSFGGDGTLQASLVAFASLNNRNHADDPEFDKLYDALLAAETFDAAVEIARQANARAHDFAPAIFMYAQPRTYVTSDRVEWTPRKDDRVRPQDFRKPQ